MAAPPPPPPLPDLTSGWQRYSSPQGVYYHHAESGQTSWTLPGQSVAPPPLPAGFTTAIYEAAVPQVAAAKTVQEPTKPRAKAKRKDVIEGTPWVRITTADKTMFFHNTETNTSEWVAPAEITDLVTQMDQRIVAEARQALEELRIARKAESEAAARAVQDEEEDAGDEDAPQEDAMTQEEMMELAELRAEMDAARGAAKKRPAEKQTNGSAKKKTKIVHALEDVDDEEWQKEIAADMAAEAEAEEHGEEPLVPVQEETSYSSEESRALFRSMLSEAGVNPFAPWEMELPKFVNDARFTAVHKGPERRDLFEDYCRDKAREKKAAKTGVKQDPAQAFRNLLVAEVTSTRTHWEDFRRAYKKDARFRDYGRDDREREQAFKKWLRDLGEIKRADAQRHEELFTELLQMQEDITPLSQWAEVKKTISSDPRYEAVGSSSLREGLFNKHLAHLARKAEQPDPEAQKAIEKKERQAASLREREAKVKRERAAVDRAAGLSRTEAGREEGQRELRSLLIDSIRDHETRWEDALPRLQRDPRFKIGNLAPHEQRRLFDEHSEELRNKRVDALEGLFERHAKQLNTPCSDIYPLIVSDPAVSRLNISPDQVERMFDTWQRRRRTIARNDFDALLGESAFLSFWGRTRAEAINKSEEEATRKALAGDEEEAVTDEVDLRAMARSVDLGQIHAVLKHDHRYRVWDYLADERERWIRDHLESLSATAMTVHQRQ